MKGKLWELGPFVIAAAIALWILLGRGVPPPAPSSPQGPRTGLTPRASTGPGDPTRPEDFLPDPKSGPDPNSLPDPAFSTASARPRK